MVGKGNLAVFEGSKTSKTREATPTKIRLHAHVHVTLKLLLILKIQAY